MYKLADLYRKVNFAEQYKNVYCSRSVQESIILQISTRKYDFADQYKKEDLAAALVHMVSMDIAQLSMVNSELYGCNRTFFCGGLLDHDFMRDRLMRNFLQGLLYRRKGVSICIYIHTHKN